ncbi:AI-2E family transporter [Oecophyllibacter saccharovorans]|uniref:AI-2E family transporter n=1 Tax=Oecophyllibacter saccharovorans TaxID=2558360 RepID=UPI001142DE8D|nr:AI-2E family transporter [Oecophyllibacter saccharovorans]QDH14640.1 AI-2E family transporter [Oecophyllibacter saccharovorans]
MTDTPAARPRNEYRRSGRFHDKSDNKLETLNRRATYALQRRARTYLALTFIGLGLYSLWNLIPALLWGTVFAICLWPIYERMEKRCGHSMWLPAAFTTLLALVFLIPIFFVGYRLTDELHNASRWLESIRQSGIPMPQWIDRLPFRAAAIHHWWENTLAQPQYLNHLFSTLDISHLFSTLDIGHSMRVTRQVGSEVLHRGLLFAFSLLTLFFLLKDGQGITARCLRGSNRLFGPQGKRLARQIIFSIHGTLSGLVLVGLGEGAIMGVAYMFAGASQPLIFALGTAVCAMVPFLGWVAVTSVSLLILVKGNMVGALVVWLLGAVLLFVADHFVRPVLIGGTTKVPFMWVLLGILGGAETWGLLGLFLGPAIMAVLHLLWIHWTDSYAQRKALEASEETPELQAKKS